MQNFVVKMSFIFMTIKNNFHINGFALSLTLEQRLEATRQWPFTIKRKTRTPIPPPAVLVCLDELRDLALEYALPSSTLAPFT